MSKSRPRSTGPRKIPDGEREHVPARVVDRHTVELGQDEGEGEEDRVVEEGLADHQREAEDRAPEVLPEKDPGRVYDPDGSGDGHHDGEGLGERPPGEGLLHCRLDRVHDRFRLRDAPVHQEPPRTLRDVAADEEDDEPQQGAETEREAPPPGVRQQRRVEQKPREERAEGDAVPVAAVDGQIDVPAHARRDQLVDGRVDGGVLAPDTGAREEAQEREDTKVGGQTGERGRREVDGEGDEEQLLSPEHVREATEEERTHDLADQVDRVGFPYLRRREREGRRFLEHGAEVGDEARLEAVEDPRDPQREDNARVPPGPLETIEAGRDGGRDDGPDRKGRSVVEVLRPHRRRLPEPAPKISVARGSGSQTGQEAATASGPRRRRLVLRVHPCGGCSA